MARTSPRIGLLLKGTQGGTLIGVRQGELDAKKMDEGRFFSSVKIRNRGDDFFWEIINVYGSVQYELKGQFLLELFRKIKRIDIPLMGQIIPYGWTCLIALLMTQL
jgi:hypothetical protein